MALDKLTSDMITDSAITAAKIADGTVVAAEIASNAVTTVKIIDDAVTTAKILDANVTTAKIAADAIDGTKLADDACNSEHYTDGSIDLAHLSADCVDGTKIADDAVNSEHYAAASIDNEHLADDAVGVPELSATGVASSSTFLRGDNSWTAVTEYNDASIRADILKLAISQAVDGNRVAFNLTDSFIDGFEDDTGITTETNVDRDTSGEYVATSTTPDHAVTFSGNGSSGSNGLRYNGMSGMTFAGDFTVEWWQKTNTAQASSRAGVFGTTNQAYWTSDAWWVGYYNSGIIYAQGTNQVQTTFSVGNAHDNNWHHMAFVRQSGTMRAYRGGVASGTTRSDTTSLGNTGYKFIIGAHEPGGDSNFQGTIDGFKMWSSCLYPNGTTFTPPTSKGSDASVFTNHFDQDTPGHNTSSPDYRTSAGAATILGTVSSYGSVNGRFHGSAISATGTLISDPQTASSSRTSCSGIIIYEDSAGTNTLGTDLKIYFTANNGTNWTEAASYTTATTYSGSKKLVKLGATTVTAGTAIAMKAVWANQGSKIARLHGWAVNY